MKQLLALSRAIDFVNEHIGRAVYWLVLIVALISAGNATSRYALNMASNAWLELQWYLFAAIFLLCAGYTLLHNEHIRIDVLSSRLSRRQSRVSSRRSRRHSRLSPRRSRRQSRLSRLVSRHSRW